MKIDGTQNINNLSNQNELKVDLGAKNVNSLEEKGIEPAAVYEELKSENESYLYDLLSIERLREGSKDVYGQLKTMIKEILTDQSKASQLLKQADIVNINVEEAEIDLAKEFFKPDGPRSIEAISEKIVEFVKAASGDNEKKLDILIKAIDIVFKEAEEDLKQLPEISQKTYDRIMEKLDKLISIEGLEIELESENIDVQLKEMVEGMLEDQGKALELLKQADIVRSGETGIVEAEEFIRADGSLDMEAMGEKLIEEVLTNQDKALELLKQMETVEKDAGTMAEVKELIRPNGKLSIETVSEKIVDFIKLASDGDKEKLDSLIRVIDKSFRGAENNLGQLPMLSQKTYKRIIQRLEDWEEEQERRRHQGPAIFAEFMDFQRKSNKNIFKMNTYMLIILASLILYFIIRVLM